MSRSHNHKKWYRGTYRSSVNNRSCAKYRCSNCGCTRSVRSHDRHSTVIEFRCRGCFKLVHEIQVSLASYTTRKA